MGSRSATRPRGSGYPPRTRPSPSHPPPGVARLAATAGVPAGIKALRHYNATQLLRRRRRPAHHRRPARPRRAIIDLRVCAHKVAKADRRAAQVLTHQLCRPTT
ncbi:MAG TPA: hypothetical protein VKP11_05670 [Frankiaceae bacterium]|nr:hypothetical protein [Frankiaceae bacterium]